MRKPDNMLQYLQGYTDYFYNWEDAGEVIALTRGGTICYREYLFDVLRSLASGGVPSLGTLLLCILATDAKGFEVVSAAQLYEVIKDRFAKQHPQTRNFEEVNHAFLFLEMLNQLPVKYKTGSRRLQVLQAIFQNGHNLISGRFVNRVMADAKVMPPDYTSLCHPEEKAMAVVFRDISPLALLHQKFPDTASILAAVTGLPPLEEPLQIPEILPTQCPIPPANFVEELKRNETTFPIGALLPSIWAGLHTPLHNRQPSAQPLGGISDISNRGTLDKLLISEHAYDDVLALSRLANGEALYYRREVPPEAQSRGRILLLDVSLQGWGTPHTVNFALLLAIAAHPKTDILCTAFTVGSTLKPVSFSNVHEVIDSLSLLEAVTDAAGGIAQFFQDSDVPKGGEVFFLTSPAGFRQPAVQQLLSAQKSIQYCIVASAAGECTVYKRVGPGLEKTQSFTLPLGKLWKRTPSETPIAGGTSSSMLKLSNTYPILFPRPTVIKQFLKTPDGTTYGVSSEKALLIRETGESHKGWTPVLEGLPAGPCRYEIGMGEEGQPVFLCFIINTRALFFYNLGAGESTSLVLTKAVFGKGLPAFIPQSESANESAFLMLIGRQVWRIPLNADVGTVPLSLADFTLVDETMLGFDKLYKEREAHCQKDNGWLTGNNFKNIKSIYINKNAQLLINVRAIVPCGLDKNGYFEFVANGPQPSLVQAVSNSNTLWTFKDGSKIMLNTNGMLVLESSHPEFETIYLPSVTGAGIGMATTSHFAGNSYYRSLNMHNQKVISATEFHRLHTQPFIDHILNHEA